jgi:hypothetical protein
MCSCFIYVFVWVFVEREGVGHIKMGGEFLLAEYGVFILPRNEIIVAFSTSTVFYCTNVAHGYDIRLVCHTQQNAMCKKNHNTDRRDLIIL